MFHIHSDLLSEYRENILFLSFFSLSLSLSLSHTHTHRSVCSTLYNTVVELNTRIVLFRCSPYVLPQSASATTARATGATSSTTASACRWPSRWWRSVSRSAAPCASSASTLPSGSSPTLAPSLLGARAFFCLQICDLITSRMIELLIDHDH